MLNEEDYHDDDFIDAIEAINVNRQLSGQGRARQHIVLNVLRVHAEETDPTRNLGGIQAPLLLELINKRKELRDATNNSLKQGDASQADSTPSKPNAP